MDTYMTSIQQHLKLALTQQYDTVNEFQESITHNSLDEDEIGYTHNLDDSLCIQDSFSQLGRSCCFFCWIFALIWNIINTSYANNAIWVNSST